MADIVKHYLQNKGQGKDKSASYKMHVVFLINLKNLTLTFLLIYSQQLSFTIRAFAWCLPSHQIMKSTALTTSLVKT